MLGRRQRKWSLPGRLLATGRRGLWSVERKGKATDGTEAPRELSAQEPGGQARTKVPPGGAHSRGATQPVDRSLGGAGAQSCGRKGAGWVRAENAGVPRVSELQSEGWGHGTEMGPGQGEPKSSGGQAWGARAQRWWHRLQGSRRVARGEDAGPELLTSMPLREGEGKGEGPQRGLQRAWRVCGGSGEWSRVKAAVLAQGGVGQLAHGRVASRGCLVAAAAGVGARLAGGEVFGSHAGGVLEGDKGERGSTGHWTQPREGFSKVSQEQPEGRTGWQWPSCQSLPWWRAQEWPVGSMSRGQPPWPRLLSQGQEHTQ